MFSVLHKAWTKGALMSCSIDVSQLYLCFFKNLFKLLYSLIFTPTIFRVFAHSRVRDPCFVRTFIRPLINCQIRYEALEISEINLHIRNQRQQVRIYTNLRARISIDNENIACQSRAPKYGRTKPLQLPTKFVFFLE